MLMIPVHVPERIASAEGKAIKVVQCEACNGSFAYELTRTARGSGAGINARGKVICQRALNNLEQLLETGIDVIPCPACGWNQANMIAEARKLRHRWMRYVGLCLTVGILAITPAGAFINAGNGLQGSFWIPWPIFLTAVVGVFAVGVGMFIVRHMLAQGYDPNDEDVGARLRVGQSRAKPLSKQEVNDVRVNMLHGLHGAAVAWADHSGTALARGKRAKLVHCEACKRNYVYELRRTGHGESAGFFERDKSKAVQRARENLERLLETGIEAIPCPACGWYQANMIPGARKRHRRWMVYVGQCLTLGLIPVALIGVFINIAAGPPPGNPPIPWLVYVGGLVCVFAVGVCMFIWRAKLAERYNPNDDDVDARKRYGQSLAILLSVTVHTVV